MKWKKWLENWDMASLKIKTPFLEMDWNPSEPDKDAAWKLYIEMITRILTQPLELSGGDEQTALNSVYALFPLTREIIKQQGRDCIEFTKIAVVVLNQVVRPFTTKWHPVAQQGGFKNAEKRKAFRKELGSLQQVLRKYSKMLADMAGVEDLTDLQS